jgi:hypothetical protein
VLLTAGGYAVYEAVTTPAALPCAARFPSGQQFALTGLRGAPLTSIELQGQSGSREWGLLKNAQVLNNAAGRPGGSLEVQLASTDDEEKVNQNGVGFVWPVPEVGKAASACLSYSVLVPAGFTFAYQGHLPGIYGATDLEQIDAAMPEDGFATRMSWAQAGFAGVALIANGGGYFDGPQRGYLWPTGRWVDVQQEVKLNTPARDDGELRIWIDGKLILNQNRVKLRKTANTGLSGVVADVGYARDMGDPAKILISPFMLQWQ